MPHVEQSIIINAPVEGVFQLIAHQPERMSEWWPPIELQERVSPPPTTVGSVARYVYNMMNVTIRGEHEIKAMAQNQHLVVKTISGIDSAFDFEFFAVENHTKLTIRVDYSLPGSVIGQIVNGIIIEKHNLSDLQQGLINLKRLVESEVRI